MKKITIIIFLMITQLSFSQNIIQNGGFESGSTNWDFISTDAAEVSIDNETVFQGNNSIKLEISNLVSIVTSGIFQTQTVQPNTNYLFSYSIKTNNVDFLAFPFFKFNDGTDYFHTEAFKSGRTKGWTTYSMRITTPSFVNNLEFFVFLQGNEGIAWIDEISLTENTYSDALSFTVDINSVTDIFNTNLLSTNCSPIRPGSSIDLTDEFRQISIKEVRTHDIYNSCDIHVIFPDFLADPLEPDSYDFTATDTVIESIINSGATPFFRLGESYEANPVNNVPPADFDKWSTICLQIVKHYNEGWHNGFYYNIEQWEIWNEPDLSIFWSGTPKDFYNLYEMTATKLKDYNPAIKVGTAGFAFMDDTRFVDTVLDLISSNNTPLDFISYHSYTFSNPYYYYINQQAIKTLLLSYGLDVNIYLTEWNNFIYNEETTVEYGKDDALSAALTASSFYYLQKSNIEAAYRYRTDEYFFGLFRDNGDYSYSGQAFRAISSFNENNQLLHTTGSDTLGVVCMAGKLSSNDQFCIIISNPNKPSNKYSVDIQNLTENYNYQITRIDKNNESIIVDSGVVSPSCNTITYTVSPPYVDYIIFENATGLSNSNIKNLNIIASPNPTTGKLIISTEKTYKDIYVSVFTVLGEKVLTVNNQSEIDISTLASGTYFVKIIIDDKIETSKILKIE